MADQSRGEGGGRPFQPHLNYPHMAPDLRPSDHCAKAVQASARLTLGRLLAFRRLLRASVIKEVVRSCPGAGDRDARPTGSPSPLPLDAAIGGSRLGKAPVWVCWQSAVAQSFRPSAAGGIALFSRGRAIEAASDRELEAISRSAPHPCGARGAAHRPALAGHHGTGPRHRRPDAAEPQGRRGRTGRQGAPGGLGRRSAARGRGAAEHRRTEPRERGAAGPQGPQGHGTSRAWGRRPRGRRAHPPRTRKLQLQRSKGC